MKKKIILLLGVILISVSIAIIATLSIIEINNRKSKCNVISKPKELPKVYFYGDISNLQTKVDDANIGIKYTSENLNFTGYANIKIQGTSSVAYDKKNYTIKLYSDENCSKKMNINVNKDWGAQNKYCLKANWIDKTHSRNIVSARIAAKIQDKFGIFANTPNNGTIDGYPIEVYLNDEFLGLYTWNIPKDAWLWNLDEENPNNLVFGGGSHTDQVFFKERITDFRESGWDCEVGTLDDNSIEKLNRLIDFVKDSSDEEFTKNISQYLDLDSTLNYITMLYIMEGVDNLTKNSMFVTYDGNIWYPSLYDLDSTFGTDFCGRKMENYDEMPDDKDLESNSLLWLRIFDCFPNEVANRYFNLRKDILTKENIMNEFNKFEDEIPAETFLKESQKWGNIPGCDISQIDEYLDYRLPKTDSNLYSKYTIEPEIEIEYSTTESTSGNVVATLKSNREDIVILKDGEISYEYSHIFTKNGTYTFEYQDWEGNNRGTIEAKVDWIK